MHVLLPIIDDRKGGMFSWLNVNWIVSLVVMVAHVVLPIIVRTKFDIYVFITITGSITLLVEY
jgi:hypothetical protein